MYGFLIHCDKPTNNKYVSEQIKVYKFNEFWSNNFSSVIIKLIISPISILIRFTLLKIAL